MAKSKREHQRLGRELARMKRKIKAAEELEEVAHLLLTEYNNVSPNMVVSWLAKLERLSKEAGVPIKPEFKEALIQFRKEVDVIERDEFEIKRAVKLFVDHLFAEGQKMSVPPHETKMCVQCGKREAHFGDVCKRCAEESGIRPRGKV